MDGSWSISIKRLDEGLSGQWEMNQSYKVILFSVVEKNLRCLVWLKDFQQKNKI